MGEFERIGDLLGRIAGEASPGGGRDLAAVWNAAVGREIAEHAQPLSVRGGRLTVATSSPAWAHTLQLMEGDILDRLSAVLPVERILFRAAGWEERVATPRQDPDAAGGA